MSRKISEFFKIEPKLSDKNKSSDAQTALNSTKKAAPAKQPKTAATKKQKPRRKYYNLPNYHENCNFCDSKIRSNYMTEHLKRVHSEELQNLLHKCQICHEKFFQADLLDDHMKRKHPNGKFQQFECDFDGKLFNSRAVLYYHMESHLSKDKCHICNVELTSHYLYYHMVHYHAPLIKFQCKLCPKIFESSKKLKDHEKRHKKTFKCKLCHKKFEIPYKLKTHIQRIHDNPEAFKCEICGKTCNAKVNLKKHMLLHDKHRPKFFKCHKCDYASDLKGNYTGHLKFHKRQEIKFAAMKNPIKCEFCYRMLPNKSSMTKHLKDVHPKTLFQCDLCGNYIKTYQGLVRHLEFHLRNM